MKPKYSGARSRAFMAASIFSTLFFTHSANAQWAGAGVTGGLTATDVSNPANWMGNVINGDFSNITATGITSLTLGADVTFANGTAVTRTLAAPFISGAATFEVTDATGIVVGAKIGGTGITLGTYVKEISGNIITPSIVTSAVSGTSYTFTPVALDFNFGDSAASGATTVGGVDLQIGSDVPGTQRTVNLSGSALMSQRTDPGNSVTFSPDVKILLSNQIAFGRQAGDAPIGTTPVTPSVTINGPVDLGGFSTTNSRLVLEAGNVSVNGLISGGGVGTGASINFGSSSNAGTLTLTNAANNFLGNITTNGFGTLTGTASVVLANSGQPSAFGAGATITTNNRSINVGGFTTPQSTNRRFSVGGGSGRLNNNGEAPVYLTGDVTNATATGSFILGGSYLSRSLPNQITGPIFNGSSTAGITVGAGVWELTNPANSFTRTVQLSGNNSMLRFSSVADSGVASTLGAGPSITLAAATNSSQTNFFEFVGTENSSTNRSLIFSGNVSGSNINSILANGAGTLNFTGPITSQSLTINGSATRTILLDGFGTGVLSGQGDLGDKAGTAAGDPPVAPIGKIALLKRGAGTWTLSGSNFNYTGPTTQHAGGLVLDYSVNDQFAAATPGALTLNGGHFTLRGKTSGTTADTLPATTLGDTATTTSDYNSTQVILDANGGSGFALTLPSLSSGGNVIRADLFDLSSSGGNSLAITALGTAVSLMNGTLVTSGSGRSTIVMRDSAGYGFPTWDSTTGLVTRLGAYTTLPASGFSNLVNYRLNNAETLTATSQVIFSTLTVDTDAGAIALNLGANTINPSGSARGLLMSGDNDFTINGTTSGLTVNSIFVHNYLDPSAAFHLNTSIGTAQPFIIGGNGFTSYTGTGLGSSASNTSGLSLLGGIFRVNTDQDISAAATRMRISDAIFEIGADLNGSAAGDFSNPVGIEVNGSIGFYYNSGISAANGYRTANFGGAGATLVWGAGGFLTVGDISSDGGFALRLSSPKAEGTIDLQNPIDLNGTTTLGRRRTVEVADGAAGIDAVLSGAISGDVGLVKTGAGTLLLSGANTYTGTTTVSAGKLLIGNASGTGTGPVVVTGSGTIGGTGTAGPTTVSGTLAVELNGAVSSKLNVTGDLNITGSALTVTVLSAPTATSYVIAEYTGNLIGTFSSVPAGYAVRYNDGPGGKQIILDLNTAPVNAFTTFINAAFPGVTDPLVIGANADPDFDGLKNSVEFVLNSNPASGLQQNLPTAKRIGNNVIVEFTRRKDAFGAGYPSVVEISTTLALNSWSEVTTGVSVSDNAGNPTVLEDVVVTVPVAATEPRLFARVKVTTP